MSENRKGTTSPFKGKHQSEEAKEKIVKLIKVRLLGIKER